MRVNCVVPLPAPLLSFGLTVTLTPLLGFEDATVSVRVVVMLMLPGGVLPGACLLVLPSMNTKLLGELRQVSVVVAPAVLLTRTKFRLNSTPEPDSGTGGSSRLRAESRSVEPWLVVMTFAETLQLPAVNPAFETRGVWKPTTVGSK